MRKFFSLALIMSVITMLSLSSCEKKTTTPETNVPTTSKGAQKQLSYDEQIEKLNSLGQQVLSNFKAQEQEDLVRLVDYLADRFYDADWSAVLDSAGNGHAAYTGMQKTIRSLRRLAMGSRYAPMNFMDNVAVDNWYVSDFFGEYEYINSDRKWRVIGKNTDAAIFRCSDSRGKKVVITVKASGDTYTVNETVKVYDYNSGKRVYSVDYWNEAKGVFVEDSVISKKFYEELLNYRDDDYEGDDYFTSTRNGVHYYVHVGYPSNDQKVAAHLPSRIDLVLTDDGAELVNVGLNFDINRKDHFNVSGNIRLANIIQKYNLNITRSAARGNYEMTVNGKSICKLVLDNNGFNALSIDPNNNLSSEKELESYSKNLEKDLKPGKTNILLSILGGEMSIQGEMDGNSYYNGLRKIEDTDYPSEEKRALAMVDNWNKFIYMYVYYGSDIKQAQIKMEVDDEHIVPVIYFVEDDMSLQFDQFFTRNSYGSLIDATEALINTYLEFLETHQVEPVDL